MGIPGSALLYLIYAMGLAAALLTAIYMTRMMLYTFHGPNRTGEKEQSHLAEAPWVMTGPLVLLGVLSAVGGWLNLPAVLPLGATQRLEHWLEPVVGESALRITHGEAPPPSKCSTWIIRKPSASFSSARRAKRRWLIRKTSTSALLSHWWV